MSRFRCKRCGQCCIVARSIHLTDDEVKSGIYMMNAADKTVVMSLKFIPELKRKKFVCYYYDPQTRLCLIHDRKPAGCKNFKCTVKNKKGEVIGNVVQEWMDEYKKRPELIK